MSGDRPERAERVLVVRGADWPVAATGASPRDPVVVVHANLVVACSAAARASGVVLGQRRREAQSRCPGARVVAPDPAAEARAFEVVVSALHELTPRLEVLEPGRVAAATRGPSRYFGGDAVLAVRAGEVTTAALTEAGIETAVAVGIADGVFAAGLAAAADPPGRDPGVTDPPAATRVVEPGGSRAFLAAVPVAALAPVIEDGPALVDVWGRLGLVRLGDLAELPAADVLARFGTPGAIGHRLARGLDARPLAAGRPASEHTTSAELDPPAEQVAAVAFVAKALAERLHQRLDGEGLACTRVVVVAESEHGERRERAWRHEGTLSATAIAERVRWQLDGWLQGPAAQRPTAGITRLTLVPDDVVVAGGRQLGFWGGEARVDERVVRALARLQGLLGTDAVRVPECRGGRDPADRATTVPAASVELTEPRPRARPEGIDEPWPGQVPPPSPATVHPAPLAAEVVDRVDRVVGVSGRGALTGAPSRLRITPAGSALAGWASITAWAGPWPVEERWWDPAAHRRRARFQVVTDDGRAHLLVLEGGRWSVEATYT